MNTRSLVVAEIKALPLNSCLVPALLLAVKTRLAAALVMVLLWWMIRNLYFFASQLHSSKRNIIDARNAMEVLHQTHFLIQADAQEVLGSEEPHLFTNPVKVIQAIPRGPRSLIMERLKAYLSRGEYSIIVINALITPIKPFQRFLIYHEAGHTSFAGHLSTAVTGHAWDDAFVFFLPCLFFCGWHSWVVLLSLAAAEVILLRGEYKAELMADASAITRIARENGIESAIHTTDLLQKNLERSFAAAEKFALRRGISIRLLYLGRLREALNRNEPGQLSAENLAFGFFGLPWFLIHTAALVLLLFVSHVPHRGSFVLSWFTLAFSLVFAVYMFFSSERESRVTAEALLRLTLTRSEFDGLVSGYQGFTE